MLVAVLQIAVLSKIWFTFLWKNVLSHVKSQICSVKIHLIDLQYIYVTNNFKTKKGLKKWKSITSLNMLGITVIYRLKLNLSFTKFIYNKNL